MNKFEALKQFQSWPPEHQRLCAECWIETGEVEPTQALRTFGERLSVSPIPFDQPKAAKVAAVASNCRIMDEAEMKLRAVLAKQEPARNNMRYTRNELIEVDSHASEGRGPAVVARIMDRKYPNQRTLGAWSMMVDRLKKKGLQAMLDRAIDVEFK